MSLSKAFFKFALLNPTKEKYGNTEKLWLNVHAFRNELNFVCTRLGTKPWSNHRQTILSV